MQNIEINLNTLNLRSLSIFDELDNYLSWMQNPKNNRFIRSVDKNYTLSQLRNYILNCNAQKDVILLGIFDTKQNVHIGNIKYDPINVKDKTATMGILIGESIYRGQGIAKIVIEGSAKWLKSELGINRICLVVESANLSASSAYKKIGFNPVLKLNKDDISMQWDI